jgi:hypothetical protein
VTTRSYRGGWTLAGGPPLVAVPWRTRRAVKPGPVIGSGLDTVERSPRGFQSHPAGDRLRSWAGRGALWGALGGMLPGNALLVSGSALGPLIAMGPLAGWVAGGLGGAALGGAAGALAALAGRARERGDGADGGDRRARAS